MLYSSQCSVISLIVRQEPGGIITYQPQPPEGSTEAPPEEELAFGASDMARNRLHLKIGDRVTFQISQRWEEKRAIQVHDASV